MFFCRDPAGHAEGVPEEQPQHDEEQVRYCNLKRDIWILRGVVALFILSIVASTIGHAAFFVDNLTYYFFY